MFNTNVLISFVFANPPLTEVAVSISLSFCLKSYEELEGTNIVITGFGTKGSSSIT